MSAVAAGRRVRVEHVMGTAVSLDLRDAEVPEDAVDAFFAWLRSVDARFSTYRADSLVSRVRRGELALARADADLREVLGMCEEARRTSHGTFDVWRHSRAGLDPSGLVKGWSIDRGAEILEEGGGRNFCVNAGGDVLARGGAAPGSPWRIGIRHPLRADRTCAVVAGRGLAVATSGAYERGDHILDPATGQPPSGLLSVTIAGPRLAHADAYATAAFAMGRDAPGWMATLPGYDGLAVTVERQVVSTAGMERLRLS